MEITLTYWERKNFHQMISNQNIGRAPLKQVSDMLELRDKLDPSELDPEKDKGYKLNITQSQFDYIYDLATNENIAWPISEKSQALFEKLEEIKDD